MQRHARPARASPGLRPTSQQRSALCREADPARSDQSGIGRLEAPEGAGDRQVRNLAGADRHEPQITLVVESTAFQKLALGRFANIGE
jgi:hypothetical protein